MRSDQGGHFGVVRPALVERHQLFFVGVRVLGGGGLGESATLLGDGLLEGGAQVAKPLGRERSAAAIEGRRLMLVIGQARRQAGTGLCVDKGAARMLEVDVEQADFAPPRHGGQEHHGVCRIGAGPDQLGRLEAVVDPRGDGEVDALALAKEGPDRAERTHVDEGDDHRGPLALQLRRQGGDDRRRILKDEIEAARGRDGGAIGPAKTDHAEAGFSDVEEQGSRERDGGPASSPPSFSCWAYVAQDQRPGRRRRRPRGETGQVMGVGEPSVQAHVRQRRPNGVRSLGRGGALEVARVEVDRAGMLLSGARQNRRLTRQSPEGLDGAATRFDFSQDVGGERHAESGDLVVGDLAPRRRDVSDVGAPRTIGRRGILGPPLCRRMSQSASGEEDRGDEPCAGDREKLPVTAVSGGEAVRGGRGWDGEHRARSS